MGRTGSTDAEPAGSVAIEHRTLPATDGYPLAATFFRPGGPECAKTRVAVLASSLGGDRRRYTAFSLFLASRGWTVVTFDCRGVGGSQFVPARRLRTSLVEWAERDLVGVLDWVTEHLDPDHLAGIGHSVGGQLFGLMPRSSRLDALVLITSQVSLWWLRSPPWNLAVLGYIGIASLLIYTLGALPLWPSGPESVPAGVGLEWRRWAFAPDYPDAHGRPLSGRFAGFGGPLLSVSFTDDPFYSPPAAVEALVALFTRADAERWLFRPEDFGRREIGHRGFFRRGHCAGLWGRVACWLESSHGLPLLPTTLGEEVPADSVDSPSP